MSTLFHMNRSKTKYEANPRIPTATKAPIRKIFSFTVLPPDLMSRDIYPQADDLGHAHAFIDNEADLDRAILLLEPIGDLARDVNSRRLTFVITGVQKRSEAALLHVRG